MSDRIGELLKALATGPFGRVLGAGVLPVWLLLLASADHGPPQVTVVTTPLLSALSIVGGIIVLAGFIWFARHKAHFHKMAQSRAIDDNSPLQNLVNLPGTVAFFAAGYQVLANFDFWRDLVVRQNWPGSASLSSWDTLMALSAIQFIFFLAQAFIGLRRS